MSLVAKREIAAGEEILVNYSYSVSQAPVWYQHLWFTHLRRDRGWTEDKIRLWVENTARMTGVFVAIPPAWGLMINLEKVKSFVYSEWDIKMFSFNSLFDRSSLLYSAFSWSARLNWTVMSVLWSTIWRWRNLTKPRPRLTFYIVNIFIFDYHLSRTNNGHTLEHFTTLNV